MRKSRPRADRRRAKEVPPRERAIRLLSRREHGAAELIRKLEQSGVAPEAAREAVDALREEGWQSDARYAAAIIRTRAGQGYGPQRVRYELEHAGVSASAMETAFEEEAVDWERVARNWFDNRGGDTDSPAGQAREWRRLMARGFGTETVRRLLRDPDD